MRLRPALVSLLSLIAAPLAAQDYRARLPEDEVIYFVLPDRFENGDPKNDRGGLSGDRLKTGYDPASKGFYHGGDLKGLIKRLDYIQGLGATAIWLGPIFRNKPVQGPPGNESAGYHGYWITDFTTVDPHLGSEADMKAFVDAAHARKMKVYMDIIVNHTADVIKYRECVPDMNCAYRSRADFPYQRRGGPGGAAINPGFTGDGDRSAANFARLTDPTYAYTPYVPAGEETVKVPAWLNDPRYYHNRGDSFWQGESAVFGDFSGLDDIATEHPRVVRGMIEIFGGWIDRFGIDGFRIDTAKHVNPEFWQAFVPAMLARAKAKGMPNFHIFGEVASGGIDPALQAQFTRVAGLPTNLDFAFAFAVNGVVGQDKPTADLARLFDDDVLYEGGTATARRLPTFLGNHDAGRVAMFIKQAKPNDDELTILKRDVLAHAMMMTLRGVPTIYSGDEQGFVGKGGDQDSRQDMFASKVATYNDQPLLGTTRTTAVDSFEPSHPLYMAISDLAKVRAATPALRRGRQVTRAAGDKPGLFAVSRFDPDTGREIVVAFNTSTTKVEGNIMVEVGSTVFKPLVGVCAGSAQAPGSLKIALAPLAYAVCAAEAGK